MNQLSARSPTAPETNLNDLRNRQFLYFCFPPAEILLWKYRYQNVNEKFGRYLSSPKQQ